MVRQRGDHVFISYSSENKAAAQELVEFLEEFGVSVWYDAFSLVPGEDWQAEIERAITSSRAIIVCVGGDGIRAGMQRELAMMLSQAHNASKPLIVVLLPGADASALPSDFTEFQYLDLREGIGDSRSLVRLLSAVESAQEEGSIAQRSRIGDTLMKSNDYLGANESYQRAYESALEALGPTHQRTLDTLLKLANAKHGLGHLTEAEIDLRKLLASLNGRDEQPRLWATAQNNLASVLRDMGRLSEAEVHIRQALEIDKISLGEGHPAYATRLNNLGSVLRDTGRLVEAEALFREALEIDRASLGAEHPTIATRLNNLGSILRDTGRLKEAEALFSEALEIDRKTLGSDHPAIANRLSNLGSVLRLSGRVGDAEVLLRQALEIDLRVLGGDHPTVANRLNSLGALLRDKGDLAEAEVLFSRALEIDRAALGEKHPSVAVTLNNLASVLSAKGNANAAIAHYDEALAILEETMGEESHLTASVTKSIGETQTRSRQLTRRQREVLSWLAYGKTLQDVSAIMGLSVATVEKHLRLAMEALETSSKDEALLKFSEAGLALPSIDQEN